MDDDKKKKDETNEKDSFASFSPDAASLARKTNVAALHSSRKTKHHGEKKHVKKEAVGKSQTPLPFATVGGMYADDMEEKLHVKQYAQKSAAGVARRPDEASFDMEPSKDESSAMDAKLLASQDKSSLMMDSKLPAISTRTGDSQTVAAATTTTTTIRGVPTPRPPIREVTPGAYRVDGIDGPSNDNDLLEDEYDTTTVPTQEQQQSILDAHLVEQQGGYTDHEDILQQIQSLEGRNENLDIVEAVVHEEPKFWQKKSAKIGFAVLVTVVIAVVVVSVVLAPGNANSSPALASSNETISPAPTFTPSASPSLEPTTAEFTILYNFVAANSLDNGAALEDPSSPQYQALKWLYQNANLNEYADAQRMQRYAMAVLYFSTNGQEWTVSDNWLSDLPECEWYNKGVTFCDAVSSGVSNFDLNGNNLNGKLPAELYLLSDTLVSLNLNANSLKGTLPTEFGLLTKLTSLNEFGLNLNDNELTGPIPTEFGQLVGVGKLDLAANNLTGPIISELGLLTAMESLNLGTNQLASSIPEPLFGLVNLVNLDLHGNEITGTVSTAFGLLTGLVDLNLDFNQHAGTIPTEFGLLVALESLKLDNNNLTGTVPSELSLLTMLGLLWLHENDFEGPYTCPPSSVIDDCRISCSSYFNAECRTLS